MKITLLQAEKSKSKSSRGAGAGEVLYNPPVMVGIQLDIELIHTQTKQSLLGTCPWSPILSTLPGSWGKGQCLTHFVSSRAWKNRVLSIKELHKLKIKTEARQEVTQLINEQARVPCNLIPVLFLRDHLSLTQLTFLLSDGKSVHACSDSNHPNWNDSLLSYVSGFFLPNLYFEYLQTII